MKTQIFGNHQVIRNRIMWRGNKNRLLHRTGAVVLLGLLVAGPGCKKNHFPFPQPKYQQVNLVADVSGYNAAKIDVNLVNPWGIAIAPSGPIWVSDNHTGLTTIYDASGNTLIPAITIPGVNEKTAGAPTGQVFNSTPDFIIPSTQQKSKFIFAGEDGVITAWSSGSAAVIVANRSSHDAVYKGLALASNGGANYLYAANFKDRTIDVFDKDFNFVTNTLFKDPFIPAGFAPFNIQLVNDKLFVTYAKQKGPDNEDDQAGPGNGYVDIFNTNGSLVKRFASRGPLNSPWGIAWAQMGFSPVDNAVLIGNFGDGRINVYSSNGAFEGQLKDMHGKPVTIDGLWAITFSGSDFSRLYFTAGPEEESHGLFGYLEPL